MDEQRYEGDKLTAVVEYFGDRLVLVFSSIFFKIEFKNDQHLLNNPEMSRRGLWVLPTIHNACLITTLMTLRDIDDFLTPRTANSRADDLKASDVGFEDGSGFLAQSERRNISQLIIHSTRRAANANEDIPWDIAELTMKGVSQGLQFLRWVRKSFKTQQNSRAWAAADFYTKQVEAIIEYLKKVGSRHMRTT